ncbi:unnamed protein product [Cuscuta campestris]|uniref:Retrotransposon Copia-like N-terminal domain-containing protein n=1 Tax=Cuscuta campestris TaxID=132261 RepID=A0A484LQ73_9ASTE|nr:unnamed protein product [Cuscuta campestris]
MGEPVTRSSIDPQSELYLHPTETSNFSLASQKLNGDNYAQWKRSAEIALSARNKLGFVDGSSKAPESNSPLLNQWKRCNNLTNAPRLFQLHKEIITLVQGSDSVSEYFTKLKGLWDTYLTMVTLPHCKCDGAEIYSKLLQNQHLMQKITPHPHQWSLNPVLWHLCITPLVQISLCLVSLQVERSLSSFVNIVKFMDIALRDVLRCMDIQKLTKDTMHQWSKVLDWEEELLEM